MSINAMLPGEGQEADRRPEDQARHIVHAGIYPGIMEDAADPEQRGRLRIRVTGVHSQDKQKVPTEVLPWALPCLKDAGGEGYGDFTVPYRVGDRMWVMFIQGREDQPVWMGAWWPMSATGVQTDSFRPAPCSGSPVVPYEPTCNKQYQDATSCGVCRTDRTDRKALNTCYPKRSARRTRAGHLVEISDEDEHLEIRVTDCKGNTVWIDTTNGELKVFLKGNVHMEVQGNFYAHATEDMHLKADGKLLLESGDIAHLKSTGANTYVDGQAVHLNLQGPAIPEIPDPATGPLDEPDP